MSQYGHSESEPKRAPVLEHKPIHGRRTTERLLGVLWGYITVSEDVQVHAQGGHARPVSTYFTLHK